MVIGYPKRLRYHGGGVCRNREEFINFVELGVGEIHYASLTLEGMGARGTRGSE